jgi:hypothetical protein
VYIFCWDCEAAECGADPGGELCKGEACAAQGVAGGGHWFDPMGLGGRRLEGESSWPFPHPSLASIRFLADSPRGVKQYFPFSGLKRQIVDFGR